MRRLRRWAVGVALGLVLGVTTAGSAEARLIDLHVGPRVGGIVGWGSQSSTPDFFAKNRGAAIGAEAGVKVLVFDLSVSFLQIIDSAGRSGTLSQAILGFEIDVPLGGGQSGDGRGKLILRPGTGGGVAFGTPGPVHPPLSNDQISDKGVVAQAKLALEYNPYTLLGFGVEGDAGYHYLFGAHAMSVSDHSSGYHVIALATLTLHLGY